MPLQVVMVFQPLKVGRAYSGEVGVAFLLLASVFQGSQTHCVDVIAWGNRYHLACYAGVVS